MRVGANGFRILLFLMIVSQLALTLRRHPPLRLLHLPLLAALAAAVTRGAAAAVAVLALRLIVGLEAAVAMGAGVVASCFAAGDGRAVGGAGPIHGAAWKM
jgi:hypothetical protein